MPQAAALAVEETLEPFTREPHALSPGVGGNLGGDLPGGGVNSFARAALTQHYRSYSSKLQKCIQVVEAKIKVLKGPYVPSREDLAENPL